VGALLAVLAADSDSDDDIDAFVAGFEVKDQADDAGDGAALPLSGQLSLNDMEISYLEVGPGDRNPELAPVVLIHGFGGDGNNWLFNMAKLGESRRVIALDLPGHGRSSKNITDGSIRGLAAIVGDFIAALGLDRVALAGHSLGAAVALHYAINNPGRVDRLALICPALVGRAVNPDYVTGFIQARTRKQLKPVLQLLFSDEQLVTANLVNDMVKYKRLDGVATVLDMIAAADLFKTVIFDPDDIDRLPMPICLISGEDDKVICGTDPGIITGDKVTTHRLKQAGHMPHMERPEKVNEILTDFFC